MPDKTPTKIAPSRNLLSKWFGQDEMTPEMQQGLNIARAEVPDLAPVEPYGLISRLFSPQAQGYTSPGRTIYLNPNQLQGQTPQDIADTIIHENTHAQQMKERGLGPTREFLHEVFSEKLPYGQRPDEMAAFQAEQERRARMGRTQTARPQFLNEGYYVPQDTYLKPEKKNVRK